MKSNVLAAYLLSEFDVPAYTTIQCATFALNMADRRAQSTADFGRGDIRRTRNDMTADTFQGKLAEVALSYFAACNFGVTPELDFAIYEETDTTDYGTDLAICTTGTSRLYSRTRIDCKATRPRGSWLLVEDYKFGAGAFALVAVSLPYNIERDGLNGEVVRSGASVHARIVGFAYHFDFIHQHDHRPKFEVRAGQKLFDMDGRVLVERMKARRSYGLPVSALRTSRDDWEALFDFYAAGCIPATPGKDHR